MKLATLPVQSRETVPTTTEKDRAGRDLLRTQRACYSSSPNSLFYMNAQLGC